MTDAEFLLHVLGDGLEHTLTEILRRSFAERGCGLTVHSRACDLRKRGYVISNRSMPGGRRGSVYQLVSEPLEAAVDPMPGALSASGVSPSTAASSGKRTIVGEPAFLGSGADGSGERLTASDSHTDLPSQAALFDIPRGAYEDAA